MSRDDRPEKDNDDERSPGIPDVSSRLPTVLFYGSMVLGLALLLAASWGLSRLGQVCSPTALSLPNP
jgi:hypothetical protein